jgi:hypothetical protein
VGYTNAGKSTLFNAVVKAKAYAADQLFATLDTTRALVARVSDQTPVPTGASATRGCGAQLALGVAVDTVGFIRDLPHKLVEASKPPCAKPRRPTCCCTSLTPPARCCRTAGEVERVLEEIGAAACRSCLSTTSATCSRISGSPRRSDWIEAHSGFVASASFVSAQTGQGLDALRRAIAHAAMQRLNAAFAPPPATLPDGITHRRLLFRHGPHSMRETQALRPAFAARLGAAGRAALVIFANRNDGPPDLDELWRDFQSQAHGLFGGKGGATQHNRRDPGGDDPRRWQRRPVSSPT